MKIILFIILILAAVLRFYSLTTTPSLNADEAAIGYNAYSLLQTGKDEHGNVWPVHFQSFNDFKPGGYFYIVLPFVKVLGLTELAVRLPGAILSICAVFLLWLLVREMFPKEKDFSLAEIAALFLAISPWHIHFSRGGWEVNAATTFILLGIYGFVKAKTNPKFLFVSVLGFVLSIYTYHAARIVSPLLVLSLLLYYKKSMLPKWKPTRELLLSGILGIIICIPLLIDLLGPAGVSRAAGVGLFADEGPFWRTNEQRGEHKEFAGIFSTLLHNKAVNYGLAFAGNYLEHFDGDFLFISGDDIQRNKVPEFGQMYLIQIVFLLAGFVAIALQPKNWWLILAWLLIAPIPAALTFQSPHALRAQNMVIPLTIISAYGLYALITWFCKHTNKHLAFAFCTLTFALTLWDFSRYLHEYYVHLGKEYPFSSQYGAKEMIEYVAQNESRFNKIYITDRYDQPYILFLFYTKYDPAKFQKEHVLTARDRFGFSTVSQFNKYHLRSIDWDGMRDLRNVLLIGTAEEFKVDANSVHTINFPNGKPAYKAVPL